MNRLQTQHEMEGHQPEEAINVAPKRYVRLKETYKRPGQTNDRLYKPEVIHPSEAQGTATSSAVLIHQAYYFADNELRKKMTRQFTLSCLRRQTI